MKQKLVPFIVLLILVGICPSIPLYGQSEKETQLQNQLAAALAKASSKVPEIQLDLGIYYFEQHQYDQASALFLEIIKQDSLSELATHAYSNLALIFKKQGRYQDALTFFQEVARRWAAQDDIQKQAGALINAAMVCKKQGDFQQQINLLFTAQPLVDTLGDQYLQSILYYSLSNAHRAIKHYPQAEKAQLQAIAIRKKITDPKGLSASYNSLANIYREQERFEEALAYYQQAIHLKDSLGQQSGLAICYHNVGSIHSEQEDWDSALFYYGEAFRIKQKLTNVESLAYSTNELALCFVKQNEWDSAQYYLDYTLNTAKGTASKGVLLRNTEIRKSYFIARNHIDSALFYGEQFLALYKEVYEQEKAQELLRLQAQYESKTKDELISGLEHSQRELAQSAQINALKMQQEKNQKYLILAIAIFVLCLIGIGFFFYRQRMIFNRYQAFTKGQEEVKTLVSDSLHGPVAGQISGIRLKISSLLNGSDKAGKLKESIHLLEQLYEQVRGLSHQLAPVHYQLEGKSFEESLSQLFGEFERLRKIDTTVIGLGDATLYQLKPDVQQKLYSVLSELLLNVSKHAKTPKIEVYFTEQKRLYKIHIRDFGIGLPGQVSEGIGLKYIQTHVKLLHGSFELLNANPGTTAILNIPKKRNTI